MQSLEHPSSLEHPEDDGQRNYHERKNDYPGPSGVAEEASKLHIHTEKAGYQCRRHQEKRHESKHLHDLVLIEVDDTENSVLEVLETLETEVGMVDKRGDVLEEDVQTRLILLRISGTLEDA